MNQFRFNLANQAVTRINLKGFIDYLLSYFEWWVMDKSSMHQNCDLTVTSEKEELSKAIHLTVDKVTQEKNVEKIELMR